MHSVPFEGVPDRNWGWNRSLELPTITPSIDVKSGHFGSAWKEGDPCWCTYNRDNPDRPSTFICYRCHSFVTDGRIAFLTDCSHALAGQTVDLPEMAEP
jgi:hypothetical protein